MKNKLMMIMLGSALFSTSQIATAGTNSPEIDKKQHHQQHRIWQGINSGQLTAKETYRLEKQQASIHKKERRFKADGNLTRVERAKLQRSLHQSSKSIYKQKHDRQIQRQMHVSQRGVKSPGVNRRQHKQARRIKQGVYSGSLTPRETARLGKQQMRIRKQERRFKADGHLNKRERVRLHKSLNRASKNIYRQKHDRQHR